MHPSALQTGELFFQLNADRDFRRVLDIGGRDVNGSLRPFAPSGAEFVSVDMQQGRGVDIVLNDPYAYPFRDGHFDCVVSTSCLEHDQMFWLTIVEATRVLAPDGLLYLSIPSQGAYHGYPYDNWRFYPDASLAVVAWSKRSGRPLRLIESFNHPDLPFNDYVMVLAHEESEVRTELLHPLIEGAYNIRVDDRDEVINPRLETPALDLVRIFGEEITRLREQVETLSKGSQSNGYMRRFVTGQQGEA